jgi:hypothetical protein
MTDIVAVRRSHDVPPQQLLRILWQGKNDQPNKRVQTILFPEQNTIMDMMSLSIAVLQRMRNIRQPRFETSNVGLQWRWFTVRWPNSMLLSRRKSHLWLLVCCYLCKIRSVVVFSESTGRTSQKFGFYCLHLDFSLLISDCQGLMHACRWEAKHGPTFPKFLGSEDHSYADRVFVETDNVSHHLPVL